MADLYKNIWSDTLTVTRCEDGHVQLQIRSFNGVASVPLCIPGDDVDRVIAMIQGYRPEPGTLEPTPPSEGNNTNE